MKKTTWGHLSGPHHSSTSLSTARSTEVITRVLANMVWDQLWGVSGFPFTGLRGQRSIDHSWSHTSEADTLNNWTLEGKAIIISHSNSKSCQTTPVTLAWHFVCFLKSSSLPSGTRCITSYPILKQLRKTWEELGNTSAVILTRTCRPALPLFHSLLSFPFPLRTAAGGLYRSIRIMLCHNLLTSNLAALAASWWAIPPSASLQRACKGRKLVQASSFEVVKILGCRCLSEE